MFVVPLALSGMGALLLDLNADLGDTLIAIGAVSLYVFFFALVINRTVAVIRHFIRKQASQEEELDRQALAAKADRAGTPVQKLRDRFLKKDVLYLGVDPIPISWGGILLELLLLPPVGVYFLILKVTYEKSRYSANSVWTIVIGVLLMVPALFWIGLLAGLSDNFWNEVQRAFPLLSLLCIGLPVGIACIVLGLVLRRLGRENDAYRRLILIEEVTDLYRIAERMHTTYAHATRVIERLIDGGILPDAYIFHRDHELIVPGISKKIALRCRNCSGTTVLYTNEERICTYCGGQL